MRLAVIGECMLELYQQQDDLFRLGFAGDVFNMAVYYKQRAADAAVDLISAVGSDGHSQRMLDAIKQRGIGIDYVRQFDERMPGLYIVENDIYGERDFHYYRSEAAARHMFDGEAGVALLDELTQYDAVYFSGITLAILRPESRDKFIAQLALLKQQGCIICFDTNYRAKLWGGEAALPYYNLIMPYVDIVLPSLADCDALYGFQTLDECATYFLDAGVAKVVVTAGEEGYLLATPARRKHYNIEKVKAIDTTGAGDSFNGAFLAAVFRGDSDELACQQAAALAREVVQFKGAVPTNS